MRPMAPKNIINPSFNPYGLSNNVFSLPNNLANLLPSRPSNKFKESCAFDAVSDPLVDWHHDIILKSMNMVFVQLLRIIKLCMILSTRSFVEEIGVVVQIVVSITNID